MSHGQPEGIDKAATPASGPVNGGRLKHSVCRWCFGGMSLEELCGHAKAIGIGSVELLGEKEWDIPTKFGLTCAVANGPTSISRGFNRIEHHDGFVKESERVERLAAPFNYTVDSKLVV